MDFNQPNYPYQAPYGAQPMPPQQPVEQPNPYMYQQPPYNMPQPPLNQPLPPTQPNTEESYVENILRMNRGKVATVYMTYTDSNEWKDKIYRGIIETAGKDHLILSDPKTSKRFLLLLVYLDWVEFDDEINYDYPLR